MRCPKCGGKGYIEDYYHVHDSVRPLIRQCCDIAAYSRRVQLLTETPEQLFKRVGKLEPFIGRHLNVNYKGVELKKGSDASQEGEPCPVIPMRRR